MGRDRKLALVDAEGRLRLAELNVGSPQLLGIPIGDVFDETVLGLRLGFLFAESFRS
jgi:hypothetical protein